MQDEKEQFELKKNRTRVDDGDSHKDDREKVKKCGGDGYESNNDADADDVDLQRRQEEMGETGRRKHDGSKDEGNSGRR